MKTDTTTYSKLYKVYNKYRTKYKENPNSQQICCMWSTDNSPDVIEETAPFNDISEIFDIHISEEDAMILYDMDLWEAANMINKRIMDNEDPK